MSAALAAALSVLVPLALDGEVGETAIESGPESSTIAIVSGVSIVGGYVLLFLLWRYVFSAKAKAKRNEPD